METVRTSFGVFNVKWTEYMLSVGGKDWCVQIALKDSNTAMLEYLGTENQSCEVSGISVKGELTQYMTYLAFTIFRKKYPNIYVVNLIDTSSVPCKLKWPKRKESKVGLMKINLLLKGQTYYQEKYKAFPKDKDDMKALDDFNKNRSDPAFKKEYFDFSNSELQTILQPLYNESISWKDFFEKIYGSFGKDSCIYMYPWFLKAFSDLTTKEITSKWQIDMTTKPLIDYIDVRTGGGKRKTRKNIFNKYYMFGETIWNPNGVRDIPYNKIYKSFLKNIKDKH